MDLRKTILADHSKAQVNKIVKWIGKDQQRFNELFRLFLHDEYRVVQRAAWPLSYLVIAHPPLIQKHFGPLLKKLKEPTVHDAVKRNIVRLLQDINIPVKYHGEIMSTCFEYIASPAEKAAVKAFSLTVLGNFAKQYPEILPELKMIIRDRWDHESPAFHARAKSILRK